MNKDTHTTPADPCSHCGGILRDGCNGSGWVNSAERTVYKCPNALATSILRLITECGIPELYSGCTVDGFEVESSKGSAQLTLARSACRAYVEGFVPNGTDRTTKGLLLVGPPGTGKTHLAAAVLLALIRRHGIRGLFADFTTICHDIQASFGDQETSEARILRPLLETPVLVLDELGARRPTAFVQDTLYLVINTRYSALKPTIFTTNHPLDVTGARASKPTSTAASLDRATGRKAETVRDADELFPPLSERVGPRIYSRLHEATMQPIVLDQVDDYRRRLSSRPLPKR